MPVRECHLSPPLPAPPLEASLCASGGRGAAHRRDGAGGGGDAPAARPKAAPSVAAPPAASCSALGHAASGRAGWAAGPVSVLRDAAATPRTARQQTARAHITRTHARTHARMHACTHTHTHTGHTDLHLDSRPVRRPQSYHQPHLPPPPNHHHQQHHQHADYLIPGPRQSKVSRRRCARARAWMPPPLLSLGVDGSGASGRLQYESSRDAPPTDASGASGARQEQIRPPVDPRQDRILHHAANGRVRRASQAHRDGVPPRPRRRASQALLARADGQRSQAPATASPPTMPAARGPRP
jgi:hypothetical protein